MEKNVGIWIDYEKAIIVRLTNGRESVVELPSHVEGQVRVAGGMPSSIRYDSQDYSLESRIRERRRSELHKFYRRVIQQCEDADRIFLFGPGEARLELKKEMRRDMDRFAKIVGVERADRMTEQQVVSKVKAFFGVGELKACHS